MLKILTLLILVSCGSTNGTDKRAIKSIKLEERKSYKVVIPNNNFVISTIRENKKEAILEEYNEGTKLSEIIGSISSSEYFKFRSNEELGKKLHSSKNINEVIEISINSISDSFIETQIKDLENKFKGTILEIDEHGYIILKNKNFFLDKNIGKLTDPLNAEIKPLMSEFKFENGQFYYYIYGPLELVEIK